MATAKRHRQHTPNQPPAGAAGKPAASSAGQPTISVRAERSAQSLAAERAALTLRRAKLASAVAAPIILITALLLFYRPFAQAPADGAVQAPATSAPAAQPLPTAAPAIVAPQPTAQPLPTAAPVAASPQPAAPTSALPTCEAIAGLPLYTGASCITHKLDSDDGVLKAKNTYTTAAAADEVRRFYEGAFASGGWALQEFSYEVDLGARRLTVQVEAEQGANGPFTKVQLTERGATAGASSTCAAIADLPAYTGAACSDFDAKQDDGALKIENTYTTNASPEDVRRFYADVFARNSWAGQDFAYQVAQGQRRLQVDVEAQTGASGVLTEIKIAEK